MNDRADPRLLKRCFVLASAGAVFSMVAGLLALAGWRMHVYALATWVIAPVKIAPNAAVCLVLLGVSLWLSRRQNDPAFTRNNKLTAKTLALLVCLLALLSLAEHAFGWHFGIDELLIVVPPSLAIPGVRPGLMATIAALNFLALGTSFLILDWKTRRGHWPAQFLSLGAAIGAVFGIFALILQPRATGITMALPVAATSIVLASGLTCSRAAWAVGGLLTSQSAGARLLRRVVPVAVLVLSLIGWSVSKALLTSSHFSWVEATLLGIVCAVLLVSLVTWIAFIIDHSDNLNLELERRVAERTAALQESEERLAGIINSALDAIITVDEGQHIVLFNAAAEKIFRCRAQAALGQPLERFIPRRFRAAHAGHVQQFGKTEVNSRAMGEMRALQAQRADGEEFQIEAFISQVESAGKKLFTVNLRDVTERIQAAEGRDRLAAVVDSTDDAIITKNLDGIITSWNRGAENVFGYRAEEMLGKEMLLLFPPELLQEEADILARIGRGENVQHYETVRLRKDGQRIDVSVTISPLRDSTGTIIGASKVARDITERRRAEESLRESEERFQAMANGIPQLAWMAEADGHIFWYNQRWFDYTGTTSEQMKGSGWQSVHDPKMLPKVLEGWTSSIADGTDFEMEFPLRAADGHFGTFLTRVTPLKDSSGKVMRWFGTNTDISERKLAEERLAQLAREVSHHAKELADSREALEIQSRMLRLVLHSMGEGLVAADMEGRFLIWNDAARKLLGRGPEDLGPDQWSSHYGCFQLDGVTPVPADRLPLVRAMHGESLQTQIIIRHPGNAAGLLVEFSGQPMKDDRGNLLGGVVAFRDITQRRADEQEIHKLNDELEIRVLERTAQLKTANEELESFTYSVSHDLRAPLRHIAGFSSLLVEECAATLDERGQHYVRRIQEGTRRMGQLVDELLNLARVGRHPASPQVVELNVLVDEVIALLEPEWEGRDVDWKIVRLPAVECDPTLMKLVFQNLLSNALKYSRPRHPAVIEVGTTETDQQTVIFVRDNGVGFSMKYADKLFGVFQRLHRDEDFEGTGVGLAIVQRIVKRYGGRLWAEADLDKGATFYFTVGKSFQREPTSSAADAGK